MLLRKNNKGITGIVDAMIFITIMTLAFTAMYTIGLDDDENDNDASELIDTLLQSKFKLKDIMDTDDSKIVSMTDILAATTINGNDEIPTYLTSILNSITGNPNSYHLNVTYGDKTFSIGEVHDIARCSDHTESQSTYGGVVNILLELY